MYRFSYSTFSIVTINIISYISGLGGRLYWMIPSCKFFSDKYDDDKEQNYGSDDLKDYYLEKDKKDLDRCNR